MTKLIHKETGLIGEEIDGKIVLQKTDGWEVVEESKVPNDIDDAWSNNRYMVNTNPAVNYIGKVIETAYKMGSRPTKELAEACLAMSQLAQLRNRTWENCGNWESDWTNKEDKSVIFFNNGSPCIGLNYSAQQFLAFPTEEIAREFLNKHKELIEVAKPLL